jgi:5-methylcytosine-specific restriction protein A
MSILWWKSKNTIVNDKELVQWITALIRHNKIVVFYKSKEWRILRAEVLKDQHNECQMCKDNGVYEEATMVHHIKYVRQYLQLALTKSNLMALCDECHYQIYHTVKYKKQLNEERW